MNNVYVSPCAPEVQAGIVDAGGAFMKLCAGDVSSPVLFAKVGVGYSTPAYQWQRYDGTNWVDIPGENSINYIRRPTGPGNYKYRLFVAESNNSGGDCGVASDEIIIHVRNPGVPGTATNNGPVCENSVVSLSAAGGLSYTWTGPGAFSSNKANPDVIANATSSGQYTVTITDAVGCRSTATTTVRTIKPAVAVSSTQNICQGDAAVLQASGGVAYTWSPANTLSGATFSNPIARPLSTTRYTVKVRDNTNCTDTASVLVVVNTKPAITAGQDKVTVKGYPVTLDGYIQNTGSITYSWLASPTLNDVHLLNPVANPQVNTTYVLTASSGGGCGTSFDTVLVKVYNDLYIPNAFTPNGNGLNDTWHIPALQAFPDAVVSIYNRWGKKIFQRSDSSKEWDGTFQKVPQPPGAYAYIIDLKNNHPLLKGVVVLIR